jgi:formiminoglutamase
MSSASLPNDPLWVRANTLFSTDNEQADIALVGIPAHESSISPTQAHLTPQAVRTALARYSTFSTSSSVELQGNSFIDLGDIASPDGVEGLKRVNNALSRVLLNNQLLIALGGDNSITYSVARGLWKDLSNVGVITFDAHHDLRDGQSNGSPIWRLIQAGLPGKNIVQIGISDFANSAAYSKRAEDNGITVIDRAMMRSQSIEKIVTDALAIAGANGREIYVDVDVDVCDRSVAPACPASVPGGITADEIRNAVRLVAKDHRVRAIDITEIDAALDTLDQRTIRLAALLVLEAAAGVASR